MKTIEQKAREYAVRDCPWVEYDCDYALDKCMTCEKLNNADIFPLINGFLAGAKAATEWISIEDELPKNEELILAKEPDSRIDLIRGWQLLERIKPFAVADFYTHW